jgi:hypothetical protein
VLSNAHIAGEILLLAVSVREFLDEISGLSGEHPLSSVWADIILSVVSIHSFIHSFLLLLPLLLRTGV